MAFLRSDPPREPFLRAPAVVLWLIASIVAVHLAVTFLPVPDALVMHFVFVPARYANGAGPLDLTLPLVGHMFLHADFLHLSVNCLWLLAFGPIVARRYGALPFLVFFLLCGVAGALTHLAFNWGSSDPVIGASGGVAGLMGAGFRMIRWPGNPPNRLAPLLSRPIVVFSALWLVTNAIFGFTGINSGGQVQQIAWQAHMGGYFFGLVGVGFLERMWSRHVD